MPSDRDRARVRRFHGGNAERRIAMITNPITGETVRTIRLPRRDGHTGTIEVRVSTDGRLSLTGDVRLNGEEYAGGQCSELIREVWPETANLVTHWDAWHLNDMCAGTPCQTAFLRHTGYPTYAEGGYATAVQRLTDAGLNPDPETGYVYGSQWLRVEVPADVLAYLHTVTFGRAVSK